MWGRTTNTYTPLSLSPSFRFWSKIRPLPALEEERQKKPFLSPFFFRCRGGRDVYGAVGDEEESVHRARFLWGRLSVGALTVNDSALGGQLWPESL